MRSGEKRLHRSGEKPVHKFKDHCGLTVSHRRKGRLRTTEVKLEGKLVSKGASVRAHTHTLTLLQT